MGYTPAFSDIYMGTLYGRWPAAAVWASLLPLFDKNGTLDMSPQAISGMTGWPLDLLEQGIGQLMEADPRSRSPESDGRRLVLLDPARPWGWRAVNHGKYREKARLLAKNEREVATGLNRERLRDRRSPPLTAADPLSNANTDSNTDEEKSQRPAQARAARLPDDFSLTPERRLVAEAEKLPAERTFAKFCDYWRATSGAKARKHDWDATWRNWCRTEADRSRGATSTPERKTRYEQMQEALRDATEN